MNYKSKRWKNKREAILRRDGYMCQLSKRYGRHVEATTVHHIFPASYCEKQNYPREKWNSVINKTPICSRTNRIIGGNAPSQYIGSLERNHGVASEILNECLVSHQIDVDAIRADDFDAYFEARRNALLDLVEAATCKPVSGRNDVFTVEEGINDEPSDFD